MYNFL